MTDKPRWQGRDFSRREFLAYSAATGVALSVPALWPQLGSADASPAAFRRPLPVEWRMRRFKSDDEGFEFSKASASEFDTSLQAIVPGTVLNTLVNNGIERSPYSGRNWTTVRDLSPEFENDFFVGPPDHHLRLLPPHDGNYTYWFLSRFKLPQQPPSNGRVALIFRGINYSADVYLNGNKINPTPLEGTFFRHRLDVVLTEGINALAVKVNPPPLPGDPTSNNPGNFAPSIGNITWPSVGQGGDGKETLGTVVTPQFSGGWDFVLSLADRNAGIWDDVLLAVTGPARFLYDPQITTDIQWADTTATNADVLANVTVSNDSEADINVEVELEVTDGSRQITGRSPSSLVKANSSSEIPTIGVSLENAKLWWPNGYGSQPLYPTTVRILVDGTISDTYDCQTGVRLITSQVDPSGKTNGRIFTVNKLDIFIRGGVWTFPDAMLRHSPQDYDDQVRLHQHANLNLIRVWGGGIIERPEFFDACDKYGLLVWQEFPDTLDCGTPSTPGFLTNAADAILMLRNHASLALWVGGNEGFPGGSEASNANVGLQALIAGLPSGTSLPPGFPPNLPYKLDPKTQYVGSSVQAGGLGTGDGFGDGPYGIWEPRQFFSATANSYPAPNVYGFNPEYGSVGFPVIESLKNYMPTDYTDFGVSSYFADSSHPLRTPLTQESFDYLNPEWFLHHFQPFFSGSSKSSSYTRDQLLLYGEPANIEAFCEQAQAAQYQQYKALYEGLNAGMWEKYTGGNLWRSQCGWTGLKGFLYDYYLEPTAGFFGARIASAPVSLHINLATYDVTVVNNTATELPKGMPVEFRLCDSQGKLRLSRVLGSTDEPIGPSSIAVVGSLKDVVKTTTFQVVHLRLRSPQGAVLATNLDWIADTAQANSYAALRSLPRVVLGVSAQGRFDQQGLSKVDIAVHNKTDTLAFFNRVRVWQPNMQTLLAPVFPSDNYFSVLPDEQINVTLEFRSLDHPPITLTGWNSGPDTPGDVVLVDWHRD